ncbi:IS66-like element accessory protein TnpA [Thauera phenolivorans]|uniref:IS66-like element accessory protein TnpA n=1 Tax=Thauera phenolivorans TaxID=1792543 RepID=UPI000839FD0A|nr:transposase [Thauera phenolivorans]
MGIKKASGTVRRGPYIRRSPELKQAIVAACQAPGASVAAVALAHGVNANLVRKWIAKSQAKPAVAPAMRWLPVELQEERAVAAEAECHAAAVAAAAGRIEIELPGARVRVHGTVDRAVLNCVLASLAR